MLTKTLIAPAAAQPCDYIQPITLPPRLHHCIGSIKGTPAPFTMVSVNTPKDICQRDFYPENVQEKIQKHQGLNWKHFGYVTAVKYPNGELRIVDGQNRISIAVTVDPSIQQVPAHIVDVSGPEEAAKVFTALNGDRKALKSEELLFAAIQANDSHALFVEKILKQAGLACGKINKYDSQGNPNTQVKLANFEKSLKMGVLETLLVIKYIKIAYGKKIAVDNFPNNLLSGAVRLLTLEDYKVLGNNQLEVGKRFETWFTTILPNTKTLAQTNFSKYKNAKQWYNGVAYGLYLLFRVYMINNNWTCPPKKTIEKIYEDNIKDDEDEDDE